MDMEKGVGALLKEARLAQNLELSQVEEQTNIRANYLKAIEDEDYSKVPGDVFTKGIIRSYGNFLGLKGSDLVDMYKAKQTGTSVEEINAMSGAIPEKQVKLNINLKPKRDWGTGNGFSLSNLELPTKQIAMGLGAVVLLGLMYVGVPKLVDMMKAKPEQPAATVTQQVNTPVEAPKVLKDKVDLTIEAVDSCWTEVIGDGKELFSGTIGAGEKKQFTAKEKLVVKYGNIGRVKITVNGQPVDLKGEHGVATKTYAVGQPVEAAQEKSSNEQEKPAGNTVQPVEPSRTRSQAAPAATETTASAPAAEQTQAPAAVKPEPAKTETQATTPVETKSAQKSTQKKTRGDKK